MLYTFDISAYRVSFFPHQIIFKFDFYGVWRITVKGNKVEWEKIEVKDGELKKYDELYIDILRHERYVIRLNYFVFRISVDLNRSLFLLLEYDGSSASARLLFASTSFKKVMRRLKEETKGLKPRYD